MTTPGSIILEKVHKAYQIGRGRQARQITALHPTSLQIRAGDIYGLVGHSGAGKSSLLRLINRLETPSGGTLLVDGEDVTRMSDAALRVFRRRIGMIFQHFNLLASKTVFENVALPLVLAGANHSETTRRVNLLLERVGLTEQAQRYPAQLSGGQKQRVGIARALALSPKILLCDEATNALDPQTTASILSLLVELNRELGLTIVLVTHEMDVIRSTCDRVAVLEHGAVVEEGKVSDVFLFPQHAVTRSFLLDVQSAGDSTAGQPVRLTFSGEHADAAILSQIIRDTDVTFRIRRGGVVQLRDQAHTRLTLTLDGTEREQALRLLEQAGVAVERLPHD